MIWAPEWSLGTCSQNPSLSLGFGRVMSKFSSLLFHFSVQNKTKPQTTVSTWSPQDTTDFSGTFINVMELQQTWEVPYIVNCNFTACAFIFLTKDWLWPLKQVRFLWDIWKGIPASAASVLERCLCDFLTWVLCFCKGNQAFSQVTDLSQRLCLLFLWMDGDVF